MKKTLLKFSVFLSFILFFGGCIDKQSDQQVTPQADEQILLPVVVEEIDNMEPENVSVANSEVIKEIFIIAKKWEFEPSQIIVNKGDTVKLIIKSIDVKHSLAIPDFNIEIDLNPGQETIVEFNADKSGSFGFYCSVYCGFGHKNMKGTLIVK